MYAKCVYVVAACKVFDSMTVMDFILWSAMIAGHFENGDCNTGLKLFLTMGVFGWSSAGLKSAESWWETSPNQS
jgi:pentatricopeptide repeat protein